MLGWNAALQPVASNSVPLEVPQRSDAFSAELLPAPPRHIVPQDFPAELQLQLRQALKALAPSRPQWSLMKRPLPIGQTRPFPRRRRLGGGPPGPGAAADAESGADRPGSPGGGARVRRRQKLRSAELEVGLRGPPNNVADVCLYCVFKGTFRGGAPTAFQTGQTQFPIKREQDRLMKWPLPAKCFRDSDKVKVGMRSKWGI